MCRSHTHVQVKHSKINLVLEWRALISIHILVFALKVALQTAKNVSPKKYVPKKQKSLVFLSREKRHFEVLSAALLPLLSMEA